jgi:hypothetical protein
LVLCESTSVSCAVGVVPVPIYLRGHYRYRASTVVVTRPVAMS